MVTALWQGRLVARIPNFCRTLQKVLILLLRDGAKLVDVTLLVS